MNHRQIFDSLVGTWNFKRIITTEHKSNVNINGALKCEYISKNEISYIENAYIENANLDIIPSPRLNQTNGFESEGAGAYMKYLRKAEAQKIRLDLRLDHLKMGLGIVHKLSKAYVYTYKNDSISKYFFVDSKIGAIFYQLKFESDTAAYAQHICLQDTYNASYYFIENNQNTQCSDQCIIQFIIDYKISGPYKNHSITTQFSKIL